MSKEFSFENEPIPSDENPVPKWLIWVYILLPIWGIAAMFLYWNGSREGWFDRGYWTELQKAANTTFIYEDADEKNR